MAVLVDVSWTSYQSALPGLHTGRSGFATSGSRISDARTSDAVQCTGRLKTMSDVFDSKGRFTPLPDNVLAVLTKEQRHAYEELAAAAARLDAANEEAANAIAANREAVTTLHAAEAIEAKKPKHTFLDELRKTQAQWRRDHG
jgi:hypothetical protein